MRKNPSDPIQAASPNNPGKEQDGTPPPAVRNGIGSNIFGRIWAVWGILLFVSTMLIFLIPFLLFCYFLRDPVKTNRFNRFSRA